MISLYGLCYSKGADITQISNAHTVFSINSKVGAMAVNELNVVNKTKPKKATHLLCFISCLAVPHMATVMYVLSTALLNGTVK